MSNRAFVYSPAGNSWSEIASMNFGVITNAPITYEWAGRQYVLIAARHTLMALALPK